MEIDVIKGQFGGRSCAFRAALGLRRRFSSARSCRRARQRGLHSKLALLHNDGRELRAAESRKLRRNAAKLTPQLWPTAQQAHRLAPSEETPKSNPSCSRSWACRAGGRHVSDWIQNWWPWSRGRPRRCLLFKRQDHEGADRPELRARLRRDLDRQSAVPDDEEIARIRPRRWRDLEQVEGPATRAARWPLIECEPRQALARRSSPRETPLGKYITEARSR